MIEVVHLEGLPQVRKMLDQFEGQQLQNKMRVAVRAGLKPFQKTLAFEGDTPGHPHSFTKVPAGKVTTRGGASGREIEGYVRPKSPLFNIFEPGAKGHTITPGSRMGNSSRPSRPTATKAGPNFNVRRGGKPILAGPAGSGSWDNTGRKRKGAFFTTAPVHHPGMRARPILPAAFAAGEAAATDAIAKAIFQMTSGPAQ
jgi:hypothetical protein